MNEKQLSCISKGLSEAFGRTIFSSFVLFLFSVDKKGRTFEVHQEGVLLSPVGRGGYVSSDGTRVVQVGTLTGDWSQ